MKTLAGFTYNELKEKLLNGDHLHFNNETHCINTENDDFRGGEIYFYTGEPRLLKNKFHIWFNGALVHSSKQFAPAFNKLVKLFDKWHQEFTTEEN